MNVLAGPEIYPAQIVVSLIGINAIHEPGFTFEREHGGNEYLFEFFEGPVTIRDEQGCREYPGGVCILYPPGKPQYFSTRGALKHTWFQASGEGVEACLNRYRIPANKVFSLNRPEFLVPVMEEAQRQLVRPQTFPEDAKTEVGRSLFRHIARAYYGEQHAELTPFQRDVLETLLQVRTHVFNNLRRRWTVSDMATLANMSHDRFALAYRTHFRTRPIDDLIDMRLRHAEVLLNRLPISIHDASLCSGFNSASNFHVVFKDRLGKSPGDLRQTSGKTKSNPANPDNPLAGWEAAEGVDLLYLRPVGHWSFDANEDHIFDDMRKRLPLILHGATSLAQGRSGGKSLRFDGKGYGVLKEIFLDTSRDYTVAAWLMHDRAGHMTAISAGSSQHAAFYLQFITDDGGFKFAVSRSQEDANCDCVFARERTINGEWYHVAGIHDAKAQEIRLYVNGILKDATPFNSPWKTHGYTYFGCCQVRETLMDHWSGSIDDVRIYDAILTQAEIEQLYRHQPEAPASEI